MHIWEVFCTLLVYGSAIFYDPRQMESWMQFVINLNPIYWYITSVRSCVMWGEGLTANMRLTVSDGAVYLDKIRFSEKKIGICLDKIHYLYRGL